MTEKVEPKGLFLRLWLLAFFHGMAPGFWIPTLTSVLKAQGLGAWVGIIFAMIPICSLITPLLGGALADEKLAAQKLMGWCSLLSSLGICFAFGSLDFGLGPLAFLCGLACYSLLSGPTWGLLATMSITNLNHGDRRYPSVRLGATLGWMAAGFTTSHLMQADSSVLCGYAAAIARICAGVIAFTIPNTPPLGQGKSWRSALGLGAFSLFRNRNHAVLLGVSGLFAVPLTAFYMYSGEFFQMLGNQKPAATMAMAQWSEIFAMLMLGSLMLRYRFKTLLMWGLGLSVLRFGLSGYAGFSNIAGWHLAGISLHGLCYTIYFVTAQVYLDRRVEPELRGQAQGMLSLMVSGVGPLIGAFFCAWLRAICVDEKGQGWQNFWWCLASIIAVCWLCFTLLYSSCRQKASSLSDIAKK